MDIREVNAKLIAVHVGRPQMPGHQQEYITFAFVNDESGQHYLMRLALGCPTCAEKKGEVPAATFNLLAGERDDIESAHYAYVLRSNAVTREITGRPEREEVYAPAVMEKPTIE